MEIRKTATIEPLISTGNPMEKGKEYLFSAGDRLLCGTYKGLSKMGALMFIGGTVGKFKDIKFNVKPGTIKAIYEADIEILANKEGVTDEENRTGKSQI